MRDDTEKEIQAKGLTAPRVTLEQLERLIVKEAYHVFPGSTLTVCMITLANGYTVTGESACASPENFDEELGRKLAKRATVTKLWALEGYLLRQRLHEAQNSRITLDPAQDIDVYLTADGLASYAYVRFNGPADLSPDDVAQLIRRMDVTTRPDTVKLVRHTLTPEN